MKQNTHLWFPADLWIDGRWQAATDRIKVTNPADNSVLAEVARADEATLQSAVDLAAECFQTWKETPIETRGNILKEIARLLLDDKDRMATLLTLEQGKTIRQARGEVDYAASFYQWFGEQVRRLKGEVLDHPTPGREFIVEHKPIGVVGIITPWNFPLAQGAKKVAGALAAGCTMVWKPAELTPLIALAMGPIFKEAGVPDGVVNIVTSRGSVAGPLFARHPAVGVVSLTGSTETGATVMRDCAPGIKRVSLELGGNAPFIICDDADQELACEDLVAIKTLVAGQVCVTANRIFVHRSIHDAFVERLNQRLHKLHLGNGLEEASDCGPLIHDQACADMQAFVDDAIQAGARQVFGAGDIPVHGDAEAGSFFTPTLLVDVPESCRIAKEEIFGPILAIYKFDTVDEVIARSNDTPFGLSAYVYSGDYAKGKYIAERIEAGIVGVNEMRPLKAQIPFGGWKQSGIGAEGGVEGLIEFLVPRVLSLPKTFL
jgi:succinate-semialdehyde dehydrogenase/glutarate-semialdehyde dehydrogenase